MIVEVSVEHENGKDMFIKKIIISMALVLASTQVGAVKYGAPYYNNSKYSYGGLKASTVDGAIKLWWEAYQDYWNVNNCTYTLTSYPDGAITGLFTYMKLHRCTGADTVVGTINGIDVPKNQGAQCGSPGTFQGNPINIAVGNKYQREIDYRAVDPFALTISRSYNSNTNGWSFFPEIKVITTGVSVTMHRSDGKELLYISSDNTWVSDIDVSSILRAIEDASGNITGWSYVTSNDQTESYDAQGRIITVTDRNGLSHTYSYQTNSITVTHTSGDSIVYHLDSNGRVSGFTNPDNNTYQYSYDTEGRLASITFPDATPTDTTDNPQRIYHYENSTFPHALTGITDENGNRYATWAYDGQKRAISSEHANGVDKTTLTYNTDGTTTVTNPLGKQTTYHFTTIHGVRKVTQVEGHPTASCEGANKTYSYDANGNVSSKTDWNGVTTTYTYDLNRNLELTRTEAAGTPQERTITTEWHPQFRLPTKITESNKITEYTYDAQGRQLSSKISSVQ